MSSNASLARHTGSTHERVRALACKMHCCVDCGAAKQFSLLAYVFWQSSSNIAYKTSVDACTVPHIHTRFAALAGLRCVARLQVCNTKYVYVLVWAGETISSGAVETARL